MALTPEEIRKQDREYKFKRYHEDPDYADTMKSRALQFAREKSLQ